IAARALGMESLARAKGATAHGDARPRTRRPDRPSHGVAGRPRADSALRGARSEALTPVAKRAKQQLRAGPPLVLALVLLLASCPRRPEQPRPTGRTGARGALRYHLKSEVIPPRVTLGDRATWRLTADFPPGATVGLLHREPADSALDLVSVAAPRVSHEGGGVTWSSSFRVSGYTLGRIALPGVRLSASPGSGAAPDSLEFPPDTLDVDSLTAAMRGSVEPDRGPLPTELRPIDVAVAAGLGVLLVVAILALIHALRARRTR